MKTETVKIFSTGEGRDKALELTEKTGAFCGLDGKSALRLRLLSEELIELIRPFEGDLQGDFWMEAEDRNVEIHLKAEVPMDLKTRSELLAVSSSGKNAEAKGIIVDLNMGTAWNANSQFVTYEESMDNMALGRAVVSGGTAETIPVPAIEKSPLYDGAGVVWNPDAAVL
ncbi:MAG: hypothetical protein IJS85_01935, partial [Clostridiales bacterium]|nr:hypothetical protein [Clostridiales bacterium]